MVGMYGKEKRMMVMLSHAIYLFSIVFLLMGLLCVSKDEIAHGGMAVWSSGDKDEDMKMPHIRHMIQSNRLLIVSAFLAGLAHFLLIVGMYDPS